MGKQKIYAAFNLRASSIIIFISLPFQLKRTESNYKVFKIDCIIFSYQELHLNFYCGDKGKKLAGDSIIMTGQRKNRHTIIIADMPILSFKNCQITLNAHLL